MKKKITKIIIQEDIDKISFELYYDRCESTIYTFSKEISFDGIQKMFEELGYDSKFELIC